MKEKIFLIGLVIVIAIATFTFAFFVPRISNLNTTNMVKPTEPTQQNRIQALVNFIRNQGIDLNETGPLLPASEINALTAQGYTESEFNVHVSVYEFSSWDNNKFEAAKTKLDSIVAKEGREIRSGHNGAIFYYAFVDVTPENATAAKYKLAGIVSGFAGQE
jgi:hypothetical protein